MEQKNNLFNINGFIFEKEDTKTFDSATGGFRVRNFKLEIRREYEGKVFKDLPEFKLTQDKTNLLDYVEIGDEVTVGFSLGGRYNQYKDKTTGEQKKFHRTELVAFSVKKVVLPPDHPNFKPGTQFSPQNPNPKTNQVPVPAAAANFSVDDDENSDLPF